MNERRAKLAIILGTNGTGKTTLLRNIVQAANQRTLIITAQDAEWLDLPDNPLLTPDDFAFSGIQRHIFDPNKKHGTLSRIHLFRKGIVVFDDCRLYLRSNTDDAIRALLIARRQREVDIFAVGHGFTEVPPVFFTFASDLFLFRTTDEIRRRKDCLQNYDQMLALQKEINKQALSKPHTYQHVKF